MNANSQDKEKSDSNGSLHLETDDTNVYENVSKYEILDNSPFVLVDTSDGWMIVMGEHVVSKKRFVNRDQAVKYVDSKPWDLIFVGASAYMKLLKKLEKDNENFKNLNNEQES